MKRAPPTGFERALRLLAVRDRSARELRNRLQRAGCEPSEIDAVLSRLKSLGYQDDARFARARAASLLDCGRMGPRAVAVRLAATGISRELAQAAIDAAMSGKEELGLARAALFRKHPQAIGSSDAKVRARAARFLLGRGFSSEAVQGALQIDDGS